MADENEDDEGLWDGEHGFQRLSLTPLSTNTENRDRDLLTDPTGSQPRSGCIPTRKRKKKFLLWSLEARQYYCFGGRTRDLLSSSPSFPHNRTRDLAFLFFKRCSSSSVLCVIVFLWVACKGGLQCCVDGVEEFHYLSLSFNAVVGRHIT